MKTIIVKENDAGQRIDKFLSKTFKNMPSSLMYKYIRKKRIKINDKRCDISTRLSTNDKISLYINDDLLYPSVKQYDFLKAPLKINIVYEDDNILLIDKKPGLIVHQDDSYHFDCLIARIQHYLYDKGEYDPDNENSFAPALVNRIDRNTGGIVIAAKNAESLRILNQKMKDRELEKKYLCIVHGILKEKTGVLKDYLEKNESQNRVYISNHKTANSKTVITKYKVLKEKGNLSLLEVTLLTGRTHQIRAHMAYIGHPLMGDGKYGTNKINKNSGYKWQALYSYKLKFNFTTPSGILEYLNNKEFTIKDIWFLDNF